MNIDLSQIITAEDKAAAALAAERGGLNAYKRAVNFVLSQLAVSNSPTLNAAHSGAASFLVALDQLVAGLDPYDPVRLMRSDVTLYERNHNDIGQIVTLLQLSPDQMDDIMRAAVWVERGNALADWDGGTGSLTLV